MRDDERLREALLEVESLRAREAAALRETNAILAGLERMTTAPSPAEATTELLDSVRDSIPCDAALLLERADDAASVVAATAPGLAGAAWPDRLVDAARPRRIVDLGEVDWWDDRLAQPIGGAVSLLAAPLTLSDGRAAAIACIDGARGRFLPADQRLLVRLSRLASQALATRALSERNALLAQVIETSAASVAIADATRADQPLIYVNDAFERLSGYPREEVLGRNCRFLSGEPPGQGDRARLRDALERGAPVELELRNLRRDGTPFWNRISLHPVHDEQGRRRYTVATQVDVTERRAMEAERDEARRWLVAALSNTSEGFLILDRRERVVLANPRYRSFFPADPPGWEAGRDFREVWAAHRAGLGDDADTARAAAGTRRDELVAGGRQRELTLADGRIILLNERALPDGGAVSVATEITSLKATKRLLEQRAGAIDAAQDGIAITDPDGRFVYMNPSHLAMFGYERQSDVLGRRWTALYRPDQAEHVERVAMPRLAETGHWRGEVTGLARDGREVPQEVSLTLLPGIGLVCVTRDVSERQRNEQERARLREQLLVAQRQEAIGQLAAGVAHDFNNVLSAITGSAALLKAGLDPDSPLAGHVERITAAGESAAQLVARLLDLGARRPERRRLDLREALGEAAALLRPGVPSRIEVETDLPDAPVEAEADPTDLLQLVLNLGINARDAIGPAAGRINLSLARWAGEETPAGIVLGRVAPGRPHAVIGVADTGAGIAPEEAGRIFQPYFTTKGDGGTGLGLAVVSSIVQSARGAVALASAPGRGTAFRVFWPLSPAAPERPAVADAADTHAGTPLEGETILVVEDVPEVAQVVATMLEGAGAEVGTCDAPADALESVAEDPAAWSLVVTDHDMPGMTGAQLARAIAETAPALPVILCTALPVEQRPGGGDAGPFAEVVMKPVAAERLIGAARRAIRAPAGGGERR